MSRNNEAKNRNNGKTDGFRIRDEKIRGNIGQRLGMDSAVIDRESTGFTDDILGRRSPFTDITLSECDDVITLTYLMSVGDLEVMTDPMAYSMAVFCRDLSDDDDVRDTAMRLMIAKLSLAWNSYGRTMGCRHHDLGETISSIPEIVLDGSFDWDDGDCDDLGETCEDMFPYPECGCERCHQESRIPYDDEAWDDLLDIHAEYESHGCGRGCRRG